MRVAMANEEKDEEGPYWLASLLSKAKIATEAMIHSGDRFEAGWLIVHVQFYKYKREFNSATTRHELTTCQRSSGGWK